MAAYNAQFEAREPSELEAGVLAAVRPVAGQVGVAVPELDPRLSAAASELARVAPANSQIGYPLVEFAMQRNGIIEPSPHLIMIWGQNGDGPAEVIDSLSERLSEILATRTAPHTRFGVGSAERAGDEVCFVVAFQASYVDTHPIPRSVSLGKALKISGSVRTPFKAPKVFVSRPGREVDSPKVLERGQGKFSAEVRCGQVAEKHQIEITASNPSGSTVLANFPIWCGSPPPMEFVYRATTDHTDPVATEAEAVERMLELLNRDRRQAGLPALKTDARLQQVAHGYSTEMLQTGRVAHVSPTSGSAADRVDRAGIRSTIVLENVARAYGVAQAQAGLMNSPGHRANILSKEASHVGIGVVFGAKTAGGSEFFVTQLFARVPTDMDASQAVRVVAKSVVRARPLSLDPALSKIAEGFATRLARGDSTKAVERWAGAQLRSIRASYLSVSTLATAVADVEAFNPSGELRSVKSSHFGVGVAKGQHEVMGAGAYYIVLLLAQQ